MRDSGLGGKEAWIAPGVTLAAAGGGGGGRFSRRSVWNRRLSQGTKTRSVAAVLVPPPPPQVRRVRFRHRPRCYCASLIWSACVSFNSVDIHVIVCSFETFVHLSQRWRLPFGHTYSPCTRHCLPIWWPAGASAGAKPEFNIEGQSVVNRLLSEEIIEKLTEHNEQYMLMSVRIYSCRDKLLSIIWHWYSRRNGNIFAKTRIFSI